MKQCALALAACLCLAVSGIMLPKTFTQSVSYAAETVEDLASVNTYYNTSDEPEIMDLELEKALY
jgi:hypothetical protein